jgi:hypothetical protein
VGQRLAPAFSLAEQNSENEKVFTLTTLYRSYNARQHSRWHGERVSPVKKTLTAQALKVREEFQDIPLTIIHEYRQFVDDVWNLCGAIIDEPEQEAVRRSR